MEMNSFTWVPCTCCIRVDIAETSQLMIPPKTAYSFTSATPISLIC